MLIFVSVIFLILCLIGLVKYLRNPVYRKFPEPPGNILFGHMFLISSLENIIPVSEKLLNTYGSTIQLRFGPNAAPAVSAILTKDYKLIEFILNSNKSLTKAENYEYLKPWLKNGLILSDGNYWKRHRKILTPAFHFGILKNFVEVFDRVGNIFIEKLTDHAGESSVDLQPLVSLCTLDVISETAMGTKINAQSGENLHYVRSVYEICKLSLDRMLSPFKLFHFTYWLTPDFYSQKKILRYLHSFTKNVIESRKQDVITNQGAKKKAFLDMLLNLSDDTGKVLSDDEIQEEVDTFMFAGHDTTSAAICYILYCLADHPEIQEKIFQEQKSLFGDERNPTLTYSDLQNMKYLENVIKESLRLYPSVAAIGRYITEDIHFGDYVVPKNTNWLLFFYGLHRDPKYFPQPEVFNPDRFENLQLPSPFCYLPFSAGPRNCIGQKFAMLELKSIISKIICHFELEPAYPRHNCNLAFQAVLKSTNGIKISWKKRN